MKRNVYAQGILAVKGVDLKFVFQVPTQRREGGGVGGGGSFAERDRDAARRCGLTAIAGNPSRVGALTVHCSTPRPQLLQLL
jgi:hypothetical protein